jgi:hypothetical protein
MKIGILTFHRANNYGAFLQAFSLRNYLKTLGHNVDFVDYWPTAHAGEYEVLSLRNIYRHSHGIIDFIRLLCHVLLNAGRTANRKEKMQKLIVTQFQLSNKVEYSSNEELHI